MPGNTLGDKSSHSVGLPPVIFLYTLDQIAAMLNVEEATVRAKYLYYVGRTTGTKARHHMEAVNIATDSSSKPDWRVSMVEFIRWLKRMGFKIHGLTYFR
jgi:hypothetical protein